MDNVYWLGPSPVETASGERTAWAVILLADGSGAGGIRGVFILTRCNRRDFACLRIYRS